MVTLYLLLIRVREWWRVGCPLFPGRAYRNTQAIKRSAYEHGRHHEAHSRQQWIPDDLWHTTARPK